MNDQMKTDINSLLLGFTLLRDILTVGEEEFPGAKWTGKEVAGPPVQQLQQQQPVGKPGPPIDPETGLPIKRKRGRPKGSTNGGIIKDLKVLQEELEHKLVALTILEQENKQLNAHCKILELVMDCKQDEIKRLHSVQAGEADTQLAIVGLSTEILGQMRIQDMASKTKDLVLSVGGALIKSELDGNMSRLVEHMTPLRVAIKYITLLRPDRLLMSGCNVLEVMSCLEDVSVAPESHWAEVVEHMKVTPDQCMWAWTLREMFNRWHSKVMAERGEISAAISQLSVSRYGNVYDGTFLGTITDLILLDKMHANIIKERCLIILTAQVLAHKILSDVQVARLIVYTYPYVSDDLAVLTAMANRHAPPTYVRVSLSAAAAATRSTMASFQLQNRQNSSSSGGGGGGAGTNSGGGAPPSPVPNPYARRSTAGQAGALQNHVASSCSSNGGALGQSPHQVGLPATPVLTPLAATAHLLPNASAAAALAATSMGWVPPNLLQAAVQASQLLLPSGQLEPSTVPAVLTLPAGNITPMLSGVSSGSGLGSAPVSNNLSRHSNSTPHSQVVAGPVLCGPSTPGGPAAAVAVAAVLARAASGMAFASIRNPGLQRVNLAGAAASALGLVGTTITSGRPASSSLAEGRQQQQQGEASAHQAASGPHERVSMLAAGKGLCAGPPHPAPTHPAQQQQQVLRGSHDGGTPSTSYAHMHHSSHTGSSPMLAVLPNAGGSPLAPTSAQELHPPPAEAAVPLPPLPPTTKRKAVGPARRQQQQHGLRSYPVAGVSMQVSGAGRLTSHEPEDEEDANTLLNALLGTPTQQQPARAAPVPPPTQAPSPELTGIDDLLKDVIDELPTVESLAWAAEQTALATAAGGDAVHTSSAQGPAQQQGGHAGAVGGPWREGVTFQSGPAVAVAVAALGAGGAEVHTSAAGLAAAGTASDSQAPVSCDSSNLNNMLGSLLQDLAAGPSATQFPF